MSTYILVAATAFAVSVSAVVILFADRPAIRKFVVQEVAMERAARLPALPDVL